MNFKIFQAAFLTASFAFFAGGALSQGMLWISMGYVFLACISFFVGIMEQWGIIK